MFHFVMPCVSDLKMQSAPFVFTVNIVHTCCSKSNCFQINPISCILKINSLPILFDRVNNISAEANVPELPLFPEGDMNIILPLIPHQHYDRVTRLRHHTISDFTGTNKIAFSI